MLRAGLKWGASWLRHQEQESVVCFKLLETVPLTFSAIIWNCWEACSDWIAVRVHLSEALGFICFTWWNNLLPLSKAWTAEACPKGFKVDGTVLTVIYSRWQTLCVRQYINELVFSRNSCKGKSPFFQEKLFLQNVLLFVYIEQNLIVEWMVHVYWEADPCMQESWRKSYRHTSVTFQWIHMVE